MPNDEALAQYKKYVSQNPAEKEGARRNFYDTFGVDPENGAPAGPVSVFTGEPEPLGTDPASVRRQARSDAIANAKETGLSALPAIGAAGAVAATVASGGSAAPITAPLLAALIGGYTGKGVEMGLRTGTGIGAEQVPPTFAAQQMAGVRAGVEQSMFEAGAGIAINAANRAVKWSLPWAERTALGQTLIKTGAEEAKLAAKEAANADKVAGLERQITANQAAMQAAEGRANAELVAKQASLERKMEAARRNGIEERARAEHIDSAHAGAAQALEATGAGVPGAGMTDEVLRGATKPLAYELKNNMLRELGGNFLGIERAAAARAPAVPIDARRLFKPAVDQIKSMQRMEGTGGMFTEPHETLLEMMKRFEQYGKGKAPAALDSPATTDALMNTPAKRMSAAIDALDKNETLGGLLVMRSGLAMEIAQARMAGEKGHRLLYVLEPLAENTDNLIKATMGKIGWKEGPATLDAAKAAWGTGKDYLAHQVFEVASKDPGRLHELLTAGSGYTPIVKKVLGDMGVEKQLWPEVRRRWIESNFIKDGRIDAGAFMQSARNNQSVINELFDTPQAKDQFRRLHLASAKIDVLQNKALRGVADYTKAEAFEETVASLGEELLKAEARAQQKVAAAFESGTKKNTTLTELLKDARGPEIEAIREAHAAKLAAIEREQGRAGSMFGTASIPSMLISRGGAGMVMAGGSAMMGGASPIQSALGAAAGFGIGVGTKAAQDAMVRRLLTISQNPTKHAILMNALNVFEKKGSQAAGQALRLAILGYQGGAVVRDLGLMPSHEQTK